MGFNYKVILLILEWKGVSKVVLLLVYHNFSTSWPRMKGNLMLL